MPHGIGHRLPFAALLSLRLQQNPACLVVESNSIIGGWARQIVKPGVDDDPATQIRKVRIPDVPGLTTVHIVVAHYRINQGARTVNWLNIVRIAVRPVTAAECQELILLGLRKCTNGPTQEQGQYQQHPTHIPSPKVTGQKSHKNYAGPYTRNHNCGKKFKAE